MAKIPLVLGLAVSEAVEVPASIVMVSAILTVESCVVYGSVSRAVSKIVETTVVVINVAVTLPIISLQAELRTIGSKVCKAEGVASADNCLFAFCKFCRLYWRSRTARSPVGGAVSVTKEVSVMNSVSMISVGSVVKVIVAVTFALMVAVPGEAVNPRYVLQKPV